METRDPDTQWAASILTAANRKKEEKKWFNYFVPCLMKRAKSLSDIYIDFEFIDYFAEGIIELLLLLPFEKSRTALYYIP